MKNSKRPFDKTLKGLTSGWVSLSNDNKKVIAYAKTFNELIKKIEKKGKPEGVITRVATGFSSYVG